MPLFYKVPQATVIIIERLGRFHRMATSGLRFCLPFFDTAKELPLWPKGVRAYTNGDPILIELAEQQTDTQPRIIITRDNVEMRADASVFWQIVDPQRAVYEVDNLPRSITDLAVVTLRNLLGATTLNDALGARARINEGLLAEIEATSRKWGVRVNRVELQELRAANSEASEAMLQQMSADQDRKARVARAEGEREARRLKAEGTAEALSTLVEMDMAIFRRAAAEMGKERAFRYLLSMKYMETLEIISESPSMKILLPSGADMDPVAAGGLAGWGPMGDPGPVDEKRPKVPLAKPVGTRPKIRQPPKDLFHLDEDEE
jgi:regulator of protease activity HflC (stomatin/prohibitin superfamily)